MITANTQVSIRWMIARDLATVVDISAASTDPWTGDDFLECLRRRNCIGFVAECGDDIVGYMVYELGSDEIKLLTFSVHPKYRRQGFGSGLVSRLKAKLAAHRRKKITLSLRESDLATQLFFRAHAFRCVRIAKRLFEDTHEDAYELEYAP